MSGHRSRAHGSRFSSRTSEVPAEGSEKGPSKNELKKRAKEAEKAKKAAEKAAKQKELEAQKAAADEVRRLSSGLQSLVNRLLQDYAAANYGKEPLNQSQSRPRRERVQIKSLNPNLDGQTVLLRARVQTSRAQGNKMVFLNLRQRTDSVQALLIVTAEKVSKQMVKWTAGIQDESIVLVEGIVKKSPEIIKSATVGDVELLISKVSVYHAVS